MGKRFSVGMEGESDDGGRALIPEGDQILIIKSVELVTAEQARKGNAYFWWTLESKEERIEIKIVTTLIKGKRWLLKQLLSACGIEAKEDDPDKKYNFAEEDVIDKSVVATIKHIPNEFTGRDGKLIKYPKAEVKRFKEIETESPKTNKTSEDEEIPF